MDSIVEKQLNGDSLFGDFLTVITKKGYRINVEQLSVGRPVAGVIPSDVTIERPDYLWVYKRTKTSALPIRGPVAVSPTILLPQNHALSKIESWHKLLQ